MACLAGRSCLRAGVWQKLFLNRADVRPPKEHYVALLHDDGTEVTGPSYSRPRVRFTKSDKGGYSNDAPIKVRPVHVDESWGTVALSRIVTSPSPTDDECTCWTARVDRPRLVEAGDILSWGRGDLRVRLGGRITSHAARTMEDFAFGKSEIEPPNRFFAGLFSARPNPERFLELSADGYERLPITFTHGRGGQPYVAHDVRWVSTGGWDIAGLGVFDSPDPMDLDGNLWAWRPLPFGGRVVEKSDEIVQLAGTWGLA